MARRSARLGLVTAVALAAGTTSLVAVPAQASPSTTISVYVTAGHVVRMTQHMHPGVHRFKVGSAKIASFQIVKPRPGYTKAMLAHDVANSLAAQDSSTPKALRALKRFTRNTTLYGGVTSGPRHRGNMWVDLPSGTYWAADTNPPVPDVADIVTFHVGGGRVAGALPSGPVLRIVDEHTWAASPRSIPHAGVLTLRNDSVDDHFLDLARLAPHKTDGDFARWVEQVMQGKNVPPPLANVPSFDSGVVSPGIAFAVAYDKNRGPFEMLCWWPDLENGMPHAFMGMHRYVKLT